MMVMIVWIVLVIDLMVMNLYCLWKFLLFVNRLGVGMFMKEILELFVLLWNGVMIGLML